MASNGIDKPVLNVFRMFSKMSGERLFVESDGEVLLERQQNPKVLANSRAQRFETNRGPIARCNSTHNSKRHRS